MAWIVILAAAGAVWWFRAWNGRQRRRIEAIRRAVEAMRAGDYTEAAPESGGDALARLGRAVNEMRSAVRADLRYAEAERTQLEAVLEGVADAVIAVNLGGEVLFLNPAAEQLFGGSRSRRPTVLELIRSEALWQAVKASTAEGASSRTLELRDIVPNRIFMATVSAFRAERQRHSGAVIILHDITEVRRLERVRADFVANVSHELRTPLTTVAGFTEALLEADDLDPSARRRILSRMKQETDRLVAVVQDLLYLSRIEAREVELELEPVSVAQWMKGAAEPLRGRAERQGVDFTVETPSPDLRVAGDPGLLHQCLTNLLTNAFNYLGRDRGGKVRLFCRLQNGDVLVCVRDDGIGIAVEDQPRVFERFYRVDRARSRETGGTGLGLSIVRHVVERHGGRVELESQLGEGTEVRIVLPRLEG